MFGYLDFLFLSFRGRIGRAALWLGCIVIGLAQIGAMAFLLHLAGGSFADVDALDHNTAAITHEMLMRVVLPLLIVSALFLYPTYAIYTKRWHDRNKSGWWSLIGFVPLIGGFWMLIELGFLGGDDGDNDYGSR